MKINWKPPQVNSRVTHLNSNAPHSIYVVEGFARTDGTIAPSRDFFAEGIAQTNFEQEFASHFKSTGSTDAAFKATAEKLETHTKEAIESEIWTWDRETQRKNGVIARSPRDIYDQGELLEGIELEYQD